MGQFVRAQGQLSDDATPTTMHTVTAEKEMHQLDLVFFNTDTVAVEVTVYLGTKATTVKVFNATIPAPPGSLSTVPLVIKQMLPASTPIIAEAETGKANKINYFLTAIEV